MSKTKRTYAEKLLDPQWQKKRLEIFERDKFTCKNCGDTKSQLHAHHRYYVSGRSPWEYPGAALVTLCDSCHRSAHSESIGTRAWEDILDGFYNAIRVSSGGDVDNECAAIQALRNACCNGAVTKDIINLIVENGRAKEVA